MGGLSDVELPCWYLLTETDDASENSRKIVQCKIFIVKFLEHVIQSFQRFYSTQENMQCEIFGVIQSKNVQYLENVKFLDLH